MSIPLHLRLPAERPFDVAGLGQNSVDVVARMHGLPGPNRKHSLESLTMIPGGQIASAMACCARLGWRAAYVGRFGDDAAGTRGWESLAAEGVDLSGSSVVRGARTRMAVVLVNDETGERSVLWHRDPQLDLPPDAVPVGVVDSARMVLVDADDLPASIRAAERARASGAVTVVDVEAVEPGVERLLHSIDVIIVSERFPETLTGEPTTGRALERMEQWFDPALVCVTLGPGGCLARRRGMEVHVPAFPITCIDSTGAGDAFRGGFISAVLASAGHTTVAEALRYANAVAALACRAAGARDGLPRPEDLARLLA